MNLHGFNLTYYRSNRLAYLMEREYLSLVKTLWNNSLIVLGLSLVCMVSCSKEKPIKITETRESIGEADVLFTSTPKIPNDWRVVGSLSNRFTRPLITYGVAKESIVTLTVGLGGDYLGNVNRWRGQFNKDPYTSVSDITSLEKTELLGQEGFFIQEYGEFQGREKDWAMLVVMAEHPSFQIMVFKMVGPLSELEKHEENFKSMARELKVKEAQLLQP